MWSFLSEYGNWVLALLAVALWGGALGWYFYGPIRDLWRARFDEWL